MVKLLARLWRWLKNKFFPSPPPLPKPTVTKPSNLEYENALLALLEEAAKGKTWGNLQGVLITRGIDSEELARWLEKFGQRWLESPDRYEELALKLEVLANVAQGDLGNVVGRLSGLFAEVRGKEGDSKVNESLSDSSQVQDNDYEAFYNQGNELAKSGKYEEAIASYEKAINIQPDCYLAWNNRGLALNELGKYEEAIASCDRAINIQPDCYLAWNNRGLALNRLGKYEEAIASCDRAINIQPDCYLAWNNRGLALNELGKYEEAIASCDRAIDIQPDCYVAWNNRGWALNELGRYEEAIASCEKAIDIQPDCYPAWVNRSVAAYDSPGYDSFISSPEQLIVYFSNKIDPQFFQKPSPSQLNPELNKRGYEGQLASLQAELDKAILRDTHPEGWGFLHHHIGKAHYHHSRNHPYPHSFRIKAENSYKTALLTLTAKDFPELHLEVLGDLIAVLLDLDEIEEARELQRQGTDLLQLLLGEEKRTQRQKQQLMQKFTPLEQLTVDLEVKSGNFTAAWELAEESKNTCLRWLLDAEEFPQVDYQKIQKLLCHDTAIVYWHLSPSNLTTFVIFPNSTIPMMVEGNLSQILAWEEWLKKWHPDKTNLEAKLTSLQTILATIPMQEELKNRKITNLILIPHRDLHRLPLHCLFDEFICSYLPSGQIGLTREKLSCLTPLENLLLVENPESEPEVNGKAKKLGSLPYAEVECALIAELFSHRHTLANDQATKEALTEAVENNQQILHYAGHGAYNSLNPVQSCLFLTGTEQFNLTNIINLDLTAYQLVSLSACETAVTGNQTITDEYVGLVSAFLKAGVNYVISTLWEVESAATMMLMVEFYQELSQEKSPAIALQCAQNLLRNGTKEKLLTWVDTASSQLTQEKYRGARASLRDLRNEIATMEENPFRNPYYWAAFTISGR